MNEEYPLNPELTEEGKEEAQKIMDSFKPKLTALMNEVLGDLYTDVSYYVESDHWANYRNKLMDGFMKYDTTRHKHNFKNLRQAIYNNNKEAIIKDLNQDLLLENEELKKHIEYLSNIF